MMHLERITIRRAILCDLPEMLRVMDEALESPTPDHEIEQQLENWTTKFNSMQFKFYVAEASKGDLVGWCRGGVTIECHKLVAGELYDCEVQNIFLRQNYQKRGIGHEMWKILWNDILLSFRPRNLVVWSVDKEQAHKFYASLGGVAKEKRNFSTTCISTGFVWHEPQRYETTNFIIFK